MVVEVVEDLDVAAVGEVPVGGVGLPHLVGQLGLEADEGAAGPLLRLRNDQAVTREDAPDGGHRGSAEAGDPQVVGDGGGTSIVAGVAQLLAEANDGGLGVG